MADLRLVEVANSLLDTLASLLELEGIHVPDRRYVTAGEVAHDLVAEDCGAAFIVSWGGTSQGTIIEGPSAGIASQVIKCATPTSARFVVVLLRCVPTLDDNGRPPTEAALQASGEEILTDAMTLPAVAIDAQLTGTLSGLNCTLARVNNVSPIGPFGAVGGTAMELFIGLV